MNAIKIRSFPIITYIFVLFYCFKAIKSKISLAYPHGVNLNSGEILIIHKLGVAVYDSYLNNIKKEIIRFEEDERIETEEDLSKLTIESFKGYIFSIIKDKIYIFNELNGDLMYNSDKIINQTQDAEYYTLASVNITNNKIYSYVIGYVDSNNLLNLFYYEFNIELKQNQLISFKKAFKPEDIYLLNNRVLSCLYMTSIYYENYYKVYYPKTLVCFYSITSNNKQSLLSSFFMINKNGISKYDRYEVAIFSDTKIENITNIKSSTDKNKLYSIICFYDSNKDEANCAKFYVGYQHGHFTDSMNFDTSCRNKIYALDVKFFSQKQDIIFSCIGYNGILQTAIFDSNLNFPSSTIKNYYSCENIFGYSLIYNNNDSYNIISDINCNGKEYPLVGLGENWIQNDEIREKETYNETEIYNEEEKSNEEKKYDKEENYDEEEKTKEKEKYNEQESSNAYEELTEDSNTPFEFELENEDLRKDEKYETENDEIEEIKITEREKNESKCLELEKCEICDEESLSKNLCLKCNILKGYYPLSNEIFSIESNMYISNDKYVDCVNNETKPSNYYFNKELNNYSPCFETCATCDYGGNGIEHNCTSCDIDLIKKPEFNSSKNCVTKCSYYYYYTSYGQYKCSNSSQCPKQKNLLVRDIGKCTNNCKNEYLYKYQYNGECLKECPKYTKEDENFICKEYINKCYLTKYDIYLNHYNIDNEIETIVENYAKEFNYTEKHVSIYNDDLNEIIIYKNDECFQELNLQISEINFGLCFRKIQIQYKINQNLIIVVLIQKANNKNIKTTKFQIYDPITFEKIPYEEICENYSAIIQENLLQKINSSSLNINSILFLTKQNIDVFNLSSPFYIDICYSFETYNKKDIALKDRVSIFFPNITLCEDGCEIKSINLSSLKVNCDCKINNLLDNDIFGGNILYGNQLSDINTLISETNINIIKCYKYAFFKIYFIHNVSGYITGCLILFQIIFTIIYYKRSFYLTKKYIFILIEKYLQYLNNLAQKNNISNENNSFCLCEVDSYTKNNKINTINKNGPPKRKRRKTYLNRNILKLNLSDEHINNNSTSNLANKINNNLSNNINNSNNINANINKNINNSNNNTKLNSNYETNNSININVYKRKKKKGRTSKIYLKRNSRKRVSMPNNLSKFNNSNRTRNKNNLKENEGIHNYNNISNGDNVLVQSGSKLINLNNSNLKRASLKGFPRGGKKLAFLEENSNMSKDILLKNKKFEESFKDLKEEDLDTKIVIDEYLKTDLDEMDYDDAIKKDKRKFTTYLYDKMKSSQIILNTFYYNEPLRPKSIKIILFILDIDLYFLVNGLFFNEEYISEVYHLEKEDTFFSFIPRAYDRFLYATVVGGVVNYVIDCFFIEEKKIKGIFKREKDNSLFLKYETIKIIKELNKRYSYFIILSFIVTIFTWYYVSCFNYVYKYSRVEWIKSTIAIIIIMQIISIATCLIESVIRFIGFKLESEKIYKISLLL